MPAITLTLKRRPTPATLNVPASAIRPLIQADDGAGLLRLLRAAGTLQPYIHDKEWLEQVVNYVQVDDGPQGQQTRPRKLTELAGWLKLAERVGRLQDVDGGRFTLSQAQYDLIWSRITADDYRVNGINPVFAAFLLDLAAAGGRRFAKLIETDGLDYDEPENAGDETLLLTTVWQPAGA